jgi:hypothetical protein
MIIFDNLRTDIMESGSLNLPEPSGPHRPVIGLLYLYLYHILYHCIHTLYNINAMSLYLRTGSLSHKLGVIALWVFVVNIVCSRSIIFWYLIDNSVTVRQL